MSDYVYSIYSDFPNHKVDPSRLRQEIDTSAIVTALSTISTMGDDCTITFKAALSGGDETILDGLVASHSGEPLEPEETIGKVKIVDTEGLDPETATSCTEFVEVEVHSGDNTSEKIVSYPYPVDIAAARYVMEDPHYEYGDKFDVFGIPAGDPAIGGVTAPAAQDATTVHVSPTVFQVCKPGMFLKFQGHDDEYRVEAMDAVAGTVELEVGLVQAVGAGETIHIRRPFLINGWVCKNVVYAIGDLTSGSSELAANDAIRIRYYHKTTPTEDYVLPFALAMLF